MKVHELFPYLRVRNASSLIEFYKKAFGCTEKFRLVEPCGRVGHAELDFGCGILMLSEEYPEYNIHGPETIGGTSCSIHLHVDNADEWLARAVELGATLVRPATDAFYGERSGTVRDPAGHEWNIGHHIEDVTPEEMQRRYTKMLAP